MALDVDHYQSHFPDGQAHKVPIDSMNPTYTVWVGHLNREYRLYNVYPSMRGLPPVFAYSSVDNGVNEESGVVSGDEELLGLGRIDGKNMHLPESVMAQLDIDKYGPEVSVDDGNSRSLSAVETFENAICDLCIDGDNIVSIEGDLLTISFSYEAICDLFDITADYESELLIDLFDELVANEEYPLSNVDNVDDITINDENTNGTDSSVGDSDNESNGDENDMYVYQTKFKLSKVEHSGVDFTPVFIEAIDDYVRGVFVDSPEISFLYNVARVSDLSYEQMSGIFGVEQDELVQMINTASDLVSRSHRTSRKYTNR